MSTPPNNFIDAAPGTNNGQTHLHRPQLPHSATSSSHVAAGASSHLLSRSSTSSCSTSSTSPSLASPSPSTTSLSPFANTDGQAFHANTTESSDAIGGHTRSVGGATGPSPGSGSGSGSGSSSTPNQPLHCSDQVESGTGPGPSAGTGAATGYTDYSETITKTSLSIRALVSSKEAGAIIGKSGKNVTEMRNETGVKVGVSKAMTNVQDRIMTISGNLAGIAEAFGIAAKNLLATVETLKSRYGAPAVSYNNVFASDKGVLVIPTPSGMSTVRLLIPHQQMGSIIGRQGNKIKSIQANCHVRMAVSKEMLPQSTERIVEIQGTPEGITNVILEIGQCLFEDRDRAQGAILYNPQLVSSLDNNASLGLGLGSGSMHRSSAPPPQQHPGMTRSSSLDGTSMPTGAQTTRIANDGPVTIINNGSSGGGTPGNGESNSRIRNIHIQNNPSPAPNASPSTGHLTPPSSSSLHPYDVDATSSSSSLSSIQTHTHSKSQTSSRSLGAEPVPMYTTNSRNSTLPTPTSSSSSSSPQSSTSQPHPQTQDVQESLASPVISNISDDSENFIIAADMVGCIIGKGGSKIQDIRRYSGAKISIAKEPYNAGGDCLFTISGPDIVRQQVVTWLYEQLRAEKTRRARYANV